MNKYLYIILLVHLIKNKKVASKPIPSYSRCRQCKFDTLARQLKISFHDGQYYFEYYGTKIAKIVFFTRTSLSL